MSVEIITFLAAQYDEDEALACEASGSTVIGSPGHWEPSPAGDEWEANQTRGHHSLDEELLVALRPGLVRPPGFTGGHWGAIVSTSADGSEWYPDEVSPMPAFRHAARHDPARVLAEVAAKRRRLERHQPETTEHYDRHGGIARFTACEICGNGGTTDDAWPCVELLDDAAPYAGQPGYDESWRP